MAREAPRFEYRSDTSEEEEPTEYEEESEDSSPSEIPPVYPRVTSDDSGFVVPQMPSPEPTPVTVPAGTARQPTDPASGLPVRVAPKRRDVSCVRHFPVGFSEPRGKEPAVERDIPCEEPQPKRIRPAHLDWMPSTLRRWREMANLPSTYETGGSSSRPYSLFLPITGEPVELTVPTLVAVSRSLLELCSESRDDIGELRSDTSRLDGDVMAIYQRLDLMDCYRITDIAVVDVTRARLEAVEREARTSRIITGVCVLLTVLATAVGLFLPRFY